MVMQQSDRAFDPTWIRVAAEDDEATLVDGNGVPPALRAMVEAELRAIDDHTSIGALVPHQPVAPHMDAVLMTAHLPTDLDFDELLEEDAKAEAIAPMPEIMPLPDHAIVEPATVHGYEEPERPDLRAATPTGGRESDKFLVCPVRGDLDSLDDPFDVSAIAGVLEPSALPCDAEFIDTADFDDGEVVAPLAFPFVRPAKPRNPSPADLRASAALPSFGAEDEGDVTKTFCRPGADGFDDFDRSAGFVTPRAPATARGVSPQRYIPTVVGKKPLPKVGESSSDDALPQLPARAAPSPFMVAVLGFACVAALFTQVL
jgi:hypothetical protein